MWSIEELVFGEKLIKPIRLSNLSKEERILKIKEIFDRDILIDKIFLEDDKGKAGFISRTNFFKNYNSKGDDLQ